MSWPLGSCPCLGLLPRSHCTCAGGLNSEVVGLKTGSYNLANANPAFMSLSHLNCWAPNHRHHRNQRQVSSLGLFACLSRCDLETGWDGSWTPTRTTRSGSNPGSPRAKMDLETLRRLWHHDHSDPFVWISRGPKRHWLSQLFSAFVSKTPSYH